MKRKITAAVLVLLLVLSAVTAFAESLPLFVDEENLISDSQGAELSQRLEEVSRDYECDVVIVTVSSLQGKTVTEYADDYFDYTISASTESYYPEAMITAAKEMKANDVKVVTTDDCDSSLRLLEEVARDNLRLYWQPNQFHDTAYNCAAAAALAPVTTNLHVFYWDESARYPLAEGEAVWREYVRPFAGQDHALLLEFMHDDRPESLAETAKTLRRIAAAVNGEENVR